MGSTKKLNMKIIIFGAAGGTGRELVKQALAQGHEVTAFVRSNKQPVQQGPGLKLVAGDVRDYASVRDAIRGHDAVISALGTKARVGLVIGLVVVCQILAPSTPLLAWLFRLVIPIGIILLFSRRNPVLSIGAKHITDAMKELGVRRLVWQSALGIGDSRGQLGALYNFFLSPFFLRGSFADKEIQEKIIQESGLDWVIVRPGALTNAQHTGKYRQIHGGGYSLATPSIPRADVADFMLKQLTDDANLHSAPGVVS